MDFNKIRIETDRQFQEMAKGELFKVHVSKEEMWSTYLNSFPPGTNPMFRERTEHDCNCCRNYIKNLGNVVAIKNNKLITIWDGTFEDDFQPVADAMADLISNSELETIFYTQFNKIGAAKTPDNDSDIIWNHFQSDVPNKCILLNTELGTKIGLFNSQRVVYQRALNEIDVESLNTVLELIVQGSIYRGEEHKGLVESFLEQKRKYNNLSETEQKMFTWINNPNTVGALVGFRNSVIGTLVSDISGGTDLETAVKKFESKTAPLNYKRPKALATPGMIKKAMQWWNDNGYQGAELRRFAGPSDLTINNILFADRSTKPELSGFDGLLEEAESKQTKNFDNVETVNYQKFIDDILPSATALEVLVENEHENSLMSLIAPADATSKNMLKWKNNFTWSYNGGVADSMKERVKSAGGKVDGVLRFSIQWNESDADGSNDLDAHCKLPGAHIYFSSKHDSESGGQLDVDITNPETQAPKGTAVENITWADISKMPNGDYEFYVNNYSGTNTNGFRAEIEMDGEIHEFDYPGSVTSNVAVGTVTLKNGKFTIKPKLQSNKTQREIWGINTGSFKKVNMVMNSPNHWDGEETGNKHIFFILDNCKNSERPRGFYNEFLNEELNQHRKTMEMLAGKMLVEQSDEQLSGIGFSTTSKKSVLVKVTGSFTRTIKIQF